MRPATFLHLAAYIREKSNHASVGKATARLSRVATLPVALFRGHSLDSSVDTPGWPQGTRTCHPPTEPHSDRLSPSRTLPTRRDPLSGSLAAVPIASGDATAFLGCNDRHLARGQFYQEAHPDRQAPLPELLFLLPTHGCGPCRPHRRGRHQVERGRRGHQAPWPSLGNRGPTAQAAAGFAHGPAVPRTRDC